MSWFLDLLAIFFISIIGFSGFKNGIIEEMGRLIGLIVALVITINLSPSLSGLVTKMISFNQSFSYPISFTIIFSCVLIFFRLLTKLVHIAFLSRSNQWANKFLGFVFGSIKGVFIIITFTWFLSILPLKNWNQTIVKNSLIAQKCNMFRTELIKFFNLHDPIVETESYIIELTQP